LLHRVSVPSDRVVIIGAGASTLLVALLQQGWKRLIAVDISSAALQQLRSRLGAHADNVTYVHADVCEVALPQPVDVWHDRATFHFLTDPADQQRYVTRAAASLRPGGHLVLANFAPAGPEQCSGLPVARHSIDDLHRLFDDQFSLLDSFEADHTTPWGSPQLFLHALWRRRDER